MKFNRIMIGLATFVFAAATLVAVPTGPAQAATTLTQKNKDTGHDSVNKNKTKIKQEQTVTKKVKATVKNDVKGKATTGGNESKNNTSGGKITSGAVDGTVDLDNAVNQNAGDSICPTDDPADIDADQTNDTTGHDSTNVNKVNITDTHTCKDITKANVTNDVDLTGNTGDNKASNNTSSGDIKSGDVTFMVKIKNTVN